ncbi:MAG: hypothetical protein ACSHX0_13250 [Akkermansiaceae bacterium]
MMKHLVDGLGAPDSSIQGLYNSHSELVESLKPFDRDSAIQMITALETIPDLHENTLRLEVLLHLAIASCEGDKIANDDARNKWIELLESSPMTSQEDPNEDVFIGYVCSPGGGYRIFSGIFSHGDFIVERLLSFLAPFK